MKMRVIYRDCLMNACLITTVKGCRHASEIGRPVDLERSFDSSISLLCFSWNSPLSLLKARRSPVLGRFHTD